MKSNSWIQIGYNEFLYLNSYLYEFIYEFRIHTFEFIYMNSYTHEFIYSFHIWIHIMITWIHMYMNSYIWIQIWINVNYELIWFFHVWIYMFHQFIYEFGCTKVTDKAPICTVSWNWQKSRQTCFLDKARCLVIAHRKLPTDLLLWSPQELANSGQNVSLNENSHKKIVNACSIVFILSW